MEVFSWTSLLILLATILVILVYVYGFTRPDVFTAYGVPIAKPVFPFIGNMWGVWNVSFGELDRKMRKKYGKVWGSYEGRKPVLVIADCDMIRQTFVKDFEVFPSVNHVFNDLMEGMEYGRKFLSTMRNEEWKRTRSCLSPAFSTGKLRNMIGLIDDCAKLLVESFRKESAKLEGHVPLRDVLKRYQLDVIGSSAFGTKLNVLENPDQEFVQKSNAFGADEWNNPFLLSLMFCLPPKMMAMFPSGMLKESIMFYANLVKEIRRQRERDGTVLKRGDMLDNLIKTAMDNPEFTEEDLVANCAIFLLAGNETVVNGLTWSIYFMTVHEDIQDKAYLEIKHLLDQAGNDAITMDMVNECKYLETVILESLRMHSPVVRIERAATRDYDLNGIRIAKGNTISIAVDAVHHDPDYFEDPETFNPDRFSRENRQKLHSTSFLAFSTGPRNCIGMRLAIQLSIVTLARLLLNFRFVKGTKTKYPAEIAHGLVPYPKNFFVGIENRD